MLTGEAPCGAEVPSQVVPGLDPRLDQIFRRSYARRESRYADAAAALADLDAVIARPAHDVSDPVAPRSVAPRAGAFLRGLALVIDALPFAWIGAETESLRYALPLFLLYDAFAIVVAGRTVGKALMGIRVRTLEGARPAFAAALWRALARALSIAALGAGFLPALGREKRALHDLVASTVVEHDV
jgi:uncharacterized RDD family membrane protein YckC